MEKQYTPAEVFDKLLDLVRMIRDDHPEAQGALIQGLTQVVNTVSLDYYEDDELGCCRYSATSCGNTTEENCKGSSWSSSEQCGGNGCEPKDSLDQQ
jgi:hypothetical protein